MTLYQDCSDHLDLSKNMAARGRGSFSLYIYIKNLIILLVRNHWTNCYTILQNYSFVILYEDCSSHLDCQKTWLPGGGAYFPYIIFIENLKNLLVRNHRTDFNIIVQKCSFGDPRPRLFKPFGFVKKHGCQGAGLIFPIYLYRKLKKSSCLKPLDLFPYNFAEMFLW